MSTNLFRKKAFRCENKENPIISFEDPIFGYFINSSDEDELTSSSNDIEHLSSDVDSLESSLHNLIRCNAFRIIPKKLKNQPKANSLNDSMFGSFIESFDDLYSSTVNKSLVL
jgi:hypothetical protein